MEFQKFTLENGLKVIFHKDKNTPIAAVNLIYDVGSKDEDPEKTGWAHLLEHMMFEGSQNVSDFDRALENVGGSNNAFTTADYTDYYITLPKNNIETALWLESDRMLNLAFKKSKFKTQKNVVIEEFKQTTLNEPYGDDYALLSELAYTTHPYKWTTIGKEISHIKKANVEELLDFYNKFYTPANAILSIGGNFELDYIKDIVYKWFGDINKTPKLIRNLPVEPLQTQRRFATVERNVPFDMLYMTFHHGNRRTKDYYHFDIITDILDDGKSSRLYQNLVKKNKVFDEIDAFISGSNDSGLVVISGRPADGVSMEQAEAAIWSEIDDLKTNPVTQKELAKSINSLEFGLGYMKTSIMSKTRGLGYYELIGDANLINTEKEEYLSVNADDIIKTTNEFLTQDRVSVLHYLSSEKNKK